MSLERSLREEFLEKYGDQKWEFSDEDEWYYKIKSPNDQISIPRSVFIDPTLEFFRIGGPLKDPTYGRYNLPFSPREKVIREDKKIKVWESKVYLDDYDGIVERRSSSRWVWYQTWVNEEAAKQNNVNFDICFVHGISDYGGKIAAHAKDFLDAGYRLIVPDLPSHGRSTGLHVYLPSLFTLAHGIQAVLSDVVKEDLQSGLSQREVTLIGTSMGGFTCFLYALLYHADTGRKVPRNPGQPQPIVKGFMTLCPMLGIAKDTRPSYFIELVARGLILFAGRLTVTPANKGKNSEDPWVDEEFRNDPQTYHGNVRAATGIAILEGIDFINKHMDKVSLPFKILHGKSDRVTKYEDSIRFYDSAKVENKEIQLYPKTEHVMLRIGRDEKDDQKRRSIIKTMIEWVEKISKLEKSKKELMN